MPGVSKTLSFSSHSDNFRLPSKHSPSEPHLLSEVFEHSPATMDAFHIIASPVAGEQSDIPFEEEHDSRNVYSTQCVVS